MWSKPWVKRELHLCTEIQYRILTKQLTVGAWSYAKSRVNVFLSFKWLCGLVSQISSQQMRMIMFYPIQLMWGLNDIIHVNARTEPGLQWVFNTCQLFCFLWFLRVFVLNYKNLVTMSSNIAIFLVFLKDFLLLLISAVEMTVLKLCIIYSCFR